MRLRLSPFEATAPPNRMNHAPRDTRRPIAPAARPAAPREVDVGLGEHRLRWSQPFRDAKGEAQLTTWLWPPDYQGLSTLVEGGRRATGRPGRILRAGWLEDGSGFVVHRGARDSSLATIALTRGDAPPSDSMIIEWEARAIRVLARSTLSAEGVPLAAWCHSGYHDAVYFDGGAAPFDADSLADLAEGRLSCRCVALDSFDEVQERRFLARLRYAFSRMSRVAALVVGRAGASEPGPHAASRG